MIDIDKLRQLAQAATPGPWVSQGRYIGTPRHMSYIGEVRDQCGNWSDTEKSRADSAFIAAANPAVINELLSCLEEAEKDIALKERIIDSLGSTLNAVANERDDLLRDNTALRVKVEAMEKQEPTMWANSSNIISAKINKERRGAGDQHTCSETKTAYHDAPLYALPCAQQSYPPSDLVEAIVADMQAQYNSELITENDSGDPLIRLDGAIAAVEDNFAATPEAKP